MGEKQIVTTPSLFKVDETFDDPRFLRVRVAAMHSGVNLNGSYFATETIKTAKDTFANIPILANVLVYTDEDGNEYLDYSGHDMHIEDDKMHEGALKMIYDERVVGIVPQMNNFEIVHDDESGNDFAVVDALIFRDYGNYAADVLKARGGKTDVSAEIICEDLSFNASENYLEVGEMMMSGITLLGESVRPAMTGANATVFSEDENTFKREEQLIQIMQELKSTLDNYMSSSQGENNQRKEDLSMDDETKVFEGESEVIEDESKVIEDESKVVEDESKVFDDESVEKDGVSEETESEEAEAVVEETPVDHEDETNANGKFSVILPNGITKDFSLSLDDIQYALAQLVNEEYGELDNEYYSVYVYPDESKVIMNGWCSGKAYRQGYKRKKDSFSLDGERVAVHSVWLSDDEQTALDSLKANYAAISEKLTAYEEKELEQKKMDVLTSSDYSSIVDDEEYKSLLENHSEFSLDEIASKCDEIISRNVKEQNRQNYAQIESHSAIKPIINNGVVKTGRYGGMFSKEN